MLDGGDAHYSPYCRNQNIFYAVSPAKSAFEFFREEHFKKSRINLKSLWKAKNLATMKRDVQEKWKELGKEGRKEYENSAREDRNRYIVQTYEVNHMLEQWQRGLRGETSENKGSAKYDASVNVSKCESKREKQVSVIELSSDEDDEDFEVIEVVACKRGQLLNTKEEKTCKFEESCLVHVDHSTIASQWWEENLRKDWRRFYGKDGEVGFVPSSLNALSISYILMHGKESVHYMIGWENLFFAINKHGLLYAPSASTMKCIPDGKSNEFKVTDHISKVGSAVLFEEKSNEIKVPNIGSSILFEEQDNEMKAMNGSDFSKGNKASKQYSKKKIIILNQKKTCPKRAPDPPDSTINDINYGIKGRKHDMDKSVIASNCSIGRTKANLLNTGKIKNSAFTIAASCESATVIPSEEKNNCTQRTHQDIKSLNHTINVPAIKRKNSKESLTVSVINDEAKNDGMKAKDQKNYADVNSPVEKIERIKESHPSNFDHSLSKSSKSSIPHARNDSSFLETAQRKKKKYKATNPKDLTVDDIYTTNRKHSTDNCYITDTKVAVQKENDKANEKNEMDSSDSSNVFTNRSLITDSIDGSSKPMNEVSFDEPNTKEDLCSVQKSKQTVESNTNSLASQQKNILSGSREPSKADQVYNWLKHKCDGLDRYASEFIDNGFDSLRRCKLIEEIDLIEMRVKRGHRKEILKAVKDLQNIV